MQWVIAPYLVFGLISLIQYPAVSRPLDTVDGAVHVRTQLTRGENPYVTSGLSVKHEEPLVQFMEAKDRPLIYGPVHQYLSLLPAAIGQGELLPSILAFKTLYFLAGLLVLWLMWVYHTRLDAICECVVLSGVIVGWNPIMHLISHGEGHNDVLMAALLAGSIVALRLHNTIAAFAGWTGSALLKFVSAPLLFALMAWSFADDQTAQRSQRFNSTAIGLLLAAALFVAALLPFGTAGLVQTVTSRYGALVGSSGDSKIVVLSSLLSGILNGLGVPGQGGVLTALIGLALPLAWFAFTAWRGLSVRSSGAFVRVAIESFLVYVTFVSLPVYAQYVVTPVVLAGFLTRQEQWHRVAVIVASLALAWDSLFLVYLPPTFPGWELALHRLSHFAVIVVFVGYLLRGANRLVPLKWRSAQVSR